MVDILILDSFAASATHDPLGPAIPQLHRKGFNPEPIEVRRLRWMDRNEPYYEHGRYVMHRLEVYMYGRDVSDTFAQDVRSGYIYF